ncbi:crotonase/enoyl-CoA hydratase family protein [Sphingopyxis alaskensis]|jgi:enoyl-CoA hydratase|uniref:Enoyl-CoA hydratase/isomerase n=1 Tax=Sphingopyxis alaskensis (strain DSM 13593 / LMG 18877 / RB2256) TaxID=317655 RepID=Q1GV66_SPHAL|nr:crotonase/enoyl-CoA hydratase family protein [Sphingopyxis alaskensis]ABF52456.1 Enoyl-CoA hydratase/isomerase [Sphingopyxis alaskensis RB2256]MCM3421320.1 crotonase/enoyl-CoA hydratase family protein [Sphingopyxis alaskensis]
MTGAVSYFHENGVATITIDDGKVNVMTTDLLDELCRSITQARDDRSMILLRSGREKIFSAGFDVKPLTSRDAEASRALLQAGINAILALLEYPYPVVSLCAGHAYPMGAFLLLASDARIGVHGEYRVGMNEVAIGIAVPDFALHLAGYRVAPTWLHRVVALGRMLNPQEAVEAGFLDMLVPPERVETALDQTIGHLAGLNMAAHASTKNRMRANVAEAIRTAGRDRLLPTG